jgi:hypothetical protein
MQEICREHLVSRVFLTANTFPLSACVVRLHHHCWHLVIILTSCSTASRAYQPNCRQQPATYVLLKLGAAEGVSWDRGSCQLQLEGNCGVDTCEQGQPWQVGCNTGEREPSYAVALCGLDAYLLLLLRRHLPDGALQTRHQPPGLQQT